MKLNYTLPDNQKLRPAVIAREREMAFPRLFNPIRIGAMTVKNRIIMAPMESHLGTADGAVSREMVAYYQERASGGTGLVVVEFTCVDGLDGFSSMAPQLRLDNERYRVGHGNLAAAIKAGGARACVQLSHAGRQSRESVLGRTPVAPSAVPLSNPYLDTVPRALEPEEITRIIASFANAARLAITAGYDAVMLHGAHGYLLQQFLSPLVNRRTDEWGGDFERRCAFPLAVVRAVRAAIGDAALLYRLSVSDFVDGGLTLEDAELIAPRLADAGVDAFDISGGSLDRVDVIVEPMSVAEGWRLPMARRIRQASGKPVICAGVMRWPGKAEQAIIDGDIDCVSLGRALLADPMWPIKAQRGAVADIRPCTSCNWCIRETGANRGVACAENPRCGHETDAAIEPFGIGRKAVVVGGGPGGMAAALLLDQAGFAVQLLEHRESLGGNLVTSATPPGKDKLFWYHDFLTNRVGRSRIEVFCGTTATSDALVAGHPDVVVLATGSMPRPLDIPQVGTLSCFPATSVLLGEVVLPDINPAQPVAVYGGGETGAETAEYLANAGHRVVLITRSAGRFLARNAEALYRMHLLARLACNANVEIVDNTQLIAIGDGHVQLECAGEAQTREVAALVLAHGFVPRDTLAKELAANPPRNSARQLAVVCSIGDAVQVGRIGETVRDAYRLVQTLQRNALREEPIGC